MPDCFVSINPDLRSTAGHSLYLDRELARESSLQNWAFESWGHHDLPSAILQENSWLEPVFRDTSYHAGLHDDGHRERFYEDIERRLELLQSAKPEGQLLLFTYTGHICQLAAFWRLLENYRDPRLRVIFNLYAANWDFDESGRRFQFLTDSLKRILGPGAHFADRQRFILTSDSGIIAKHAEQWWHSEVPVLPFFSMARSRHGAAQFATNGNTDGKAITVAYPSSAHRQRGFCVFPTMIRQCRLRSSRKVRFVFRTCVPATSLSLEESQICRELEEEGCEIIYGSLSEDEMHDFYANADIILNPYPVRYFKDRTSGNVADALAFGKPVIAARGTWAGRLIDGLEAGVCFEDEDGTSMAEAVLKVADRLSFYRGNAVKHGAEWTAENHVGALLNRVQRLAGTPPPPVAMNHRVEEWHDLLFQALDAAIQLSPFAPGASPDGMQKACPDSGSAQVPAANLKWRKLNQRLALLKFQNERMRRAIEHFRASPVRALRLWFHRKKRRLWL